ncbi:MAG: response regulator [Terracidiphilus sp.]
MSAILLVDDDPLQAHMRKTVLERKFRNVFRAADAAEALCLVEQPQFAGNLGLVISGHHMPGIGGPAFVEELHTRMPSLPVLVLGDKSETSGDYRGEHIQFLARPFVTEEMLAAAGRMLSGNGMKTA